MHLSIHIACMLTKAHATDSLGCALPASSGTKGASCSTVRNWAPKEVVLAMLCFKRSTNFQVFSRPIVLCSSTVALCSSTVAPKISTLAHMRIAMCRLRDLQS